MVSDILENECRFQIMLSQSLLLVNTADVLGPAIYLDAQPLSLRHIMYQTVVCYPHRHDADGPVARGAREELRSIQEKHHAKIAFEAGVQQEHPGKCCRLF